MVSEWTAESHTVRRSLNTLTLLPILPLPLASRWKCLSKVPKIKNVQKVIFGWIYCSLCHWIWNINCIYIWCGKTYLAPGSGKKVEEDKKRNEEEEKRLFFNSKAGPIFSNMLCVSVKCPSHTNLLAACNCFWHIRTYILSKEVLNKLWSPVFPSFIFKICSGALETV